MSDATSTRSDEAAPAIPMPADLRIAAPGSDVPPDIARFSGGWGGGGWNGTLPIGLVVESIAVDGAAEVAYGFGASAQYGVAAHHFRIRGEIAGNRLSFRYGNGSLTEFVLTEDGRLRGRYLPVEGYCAWAWLDRVASRNPARVAAVLALPWTPLWEEIRIPLRSSVGTAAGQTLQLQCFHYPPRGPGRQPLVILNHGSTDGEIAGTRGIYPAEAEARWFLSRGFGVLVPMRKGRGWSEGPTLEETSGREGEDEQLESGIEDLHAVMNHARGLPNVDPSRIVLAGQSRGGFLAMAYAARHAAAIAGVVNFVGGWWGEDWDVNGFNRRHAALAGASGMAPVLWLYGDRDSYYSLPFSRANFEAFRTAGGRGEMVEFHDLPGSGHALLGWIDRWGVIVERYLDERV